MKVAPLRWISSVLLTVTAVISVILLLKAIGYAFSNGSSYTYILLGGVLYYVIFCILWRKNLTFLQTLYHEFIHFFVGLITFQEISSFQATAREGGCVTHYGESNILGLLAPYCFPVITFLLMLIQLIIPSKYTFWNAIVGISLFFHLHTAYVQTGFYQTDLQRCGKYRSVVYITTFLSMNTAIILYGVKMNVWKAFLFVMKDAWLIGMDFYSRIF